jgi:hypothetical protein
MQRTATASSGALQWTRSVAVAASVMWRNVLSLAAAMSLALCVAAVVAWVLSYRSESWAGYTERTVGPRNWDSRYVRIVSSKGAVWFADLQMLTPPKQALPEGWQFHWDGKDLHGGRVLAAVEGWLSSASCHKALGFLICTKPFPVAAVPYWFIVACAAALPSVSVYRRMRDGARVRAQRCPGCGYDLRATPQRCPECGRKTGEAAA